MAFYDDEDEDIPLSQMVNDASLFEESEDFSRAPIGIDMDDRHGNGVTNLSTAVRRSSGKTFNDDIWGHIHMPSWICDVIDTPQFQRLRHIRQLGCVSYVYPGATHLRFEHSIGVCHLGGCVVKRFKRMQKDLELTKEDEKAVMLAGLCHDLGHGPFSHVFENEFLKLRPPATNTVLREHEQRSAALFEMLLDDPENGTCFNDISEELRRRVCDMIVSSLDNGGRSPSQYEEKPFLHEIIANGRNSVDVDKFDYLMRDSKNCNVSISVDFNRIIKSQWVINSEICYQKGHYGELCQLFHDRQSMHERVYTHKKAKAVEYMIVDAMVAADDVRGGMYSNSVADMDDFIRMDDSLLRSIEISRDPDLAGAQAILNRLTRRDLYKFIAECVVPEWRMHEYKQITPEEMVTFQEADGTIPGGLKPEHIIIHNVKIDYALKEKNPLDVCSFFDHYGDTNSFKLSPDKAGMMLPSKFMVRRIRLYTRNSEPEYMGAAMKAFNNFQKAYCCRDEEEPPETTPLKQPRKRSRMSMALRP